VRYLEQETTFDYKYLDLSRYILGLAVVDSDARVFRLQEQIKAGQKYNMLTRKFNNSILLTLLLSIS
jgi:hypothetical protein